MPRAMWIFIASLAWAKGNDQVQGQPVVDVWHLEACWGGLGDLMACGLDVP